MSDFYENELEEKNEIKIWNYISVIFENDYYPFNDHRILENKDFRQQIYGDATQYTYKTDKILKEGQVLTIKTPRNMTHRVLVVNPYLMTEEIKYPVDKIKPIEIVGEVREDEN